MGSLNSSPDETNNSTDTNLYPSECPMSKNNLKVDNIVKPDFSIVNDFKKITNYPSECPISQNKSLDNDLNSSGLDTRNMMMPPNQVPSLGQPFPLSLERVESSIPKYDGKEGEKWVYPSAQMFWNAMIRKGWRWSNDHIKPNDMNEIINIHNANNELAWREVLLWESIHSNDCKTPKLKRFSGNSKNYSPRARFRHFIGYKYPFDRHDWVVDRCGKEVRYIIDYYDNSEAKPTPTSTLLDVRPALDSLQSIYDRAKVTFWRWTNSTPNLQDHQFKDESDSK